MDLKELNELALEVGVDIKVAEVREGSEAGLKRI